MDLLRRVGRGQLTPFAGGAPGNRELEQSIWRSAPYTEADLQAQVAALQAKGPRGAQLYADVQQYIAGINAYIAACMAARNCPGEYVLTGTSWTAVSTVDAGNGGTDSVVFAPTSARYVRMAGVARATGWGYSLWELEVYAR